MLIAVAAVPAFLVGRYLANSPGFEFWTPYVGLRSGAVVALLIAGALLIAVGAQ